jgi:N-acetylmuramoyl-L-alanine amidase
MCSRYIKAAWFVILAVFIFYARSASAETLIQNIRHWSAPDHTRIVIDTDQEPKYTVDKTEQKLNIDFQDARPGKRVPVKIVLKKPGTEKIYITRHGDRTVRVSVALPRRAEARIFKLKKFQDKPDRVVIDIEFPEVEKAESRSREAVKVRAKDRVIVIDPGHGGDDPGAIGKNGTQEKTVVLAISKKLKDSINRKDGYRAFLTRKGDYYVSFKKRLTIAREYGADLFISIHADAFWGRSARGGSVYCLSLRGAGSEAGRLLASHENLSDIVGGVADAESSDESDAIVLNMYQTNTINLSKTFGNQVLKRLEGFSRIKHGVVQEAPFRVLKMPDIPSLLIETAFISNPGEEQMLRSPRFQQGIAFAIAEAVYEFAPAAPPDKNKKILAAASSGELPKGASVNKLRSYSVKKGDTVHAIARKYDTTVAELLKINRLKADAPLYVGRKLKLPPPGEEKPTPKTESERSLPAENKERVLVYRVKKGDTLTGIANRHGLDATELAKANRLNLDDPLYVGRKIRISPPETPPEEIKKKSGDRPAASSARIFLYRVKEGDSLLTIARRCNTTIGELQDLNKLRPDEALYIDQELIVPVEPANGETAQGKNYDHAHH